MMPAATKKKTPVRTDSDSGLATVYVHKSVGAISVNGEEFARPGSVEGRSWSFECSPEDARDLIDRYEFASGSEAGVALTVDEKSELEDIKSKSGVEVGRLAQALAQLGEERVRENDSKAADS
jgi:hypothetical protein